MNTFVFATDFKEGCANALSVTKLLLQKHPGSVLVLAHAIGEADTEKESLSKLTELQLQLSKEGFSSFTYAAVGGIMQVLGECCEQYEAKMVIAGAGNYGPLAENTIGDTAERLLQELLVPVLVVPSGSIDKNMFKHITYATDYKVADGTLVKQLIALFEPFQSQVNMLHVYTQNQSAEEEFTQMEHFQKDITDKVTYNNLSFQIMHGDTVVDKLQEHLEMHAAGILVISTHHGHLFDKFFNDSVGRAMLIDAAVPILAFHYRKHLKPVLL